MATIHNTDLFKEIREGAKIQQLNDILPTQLADKIVPTMEVNPKLLRRCNFCKMGTLTNNTSASIITTDSVKETYLCSCSLGYIKDSTSTATNMTLNVYVEGVAISLIRLPGISLTADSGCLSMSFPFPIKLDKNTAITLTSDTNVANIVIKGTIQGYVVENSLA